ncbi:MAG: phytoene/squalene synthase family protein [Rhodopseudomonas sp.]|nr:phytoene/squalene synthase family protein [Rhodopseudomonas sp.]
MQDPFEHCAALVREADRDRYLSTLFAPAAARDGLMALYAFNVEISRVRDVAREPMPGEIRLQWWREVLSGERDGEAAAHPVAAALMASLKKHGIAADRLTAIVDAHTFDLYDEPMPTLDDFDNHAVMTQAALIDIAASMLGGGGFEAMMLMRQAGIALLVTSVLTHLAHHAARRQLLVPLEVLDRHGADREALFAGKASDPLMQALAELRRHGRRQLAAARSEMDNAPPTVIAPMLPALLPLALVGPSLRPMERRGYEPFDVQPLSQLRRQWLLWRASRDPARIFTG